MIVPSVTSRSRTPIRAPLTAMVRSGVMGCPMAPEFSMPTWTFWRRLSAMRTNEIS
jgi:hypothetical protein